MGEVYCARDTRLDRTVAIKVLPAAFSQRPELRTRLEREARTLSSLSHPHICTLYDVGQQDGVDFLVMEYLEGDTLGHRLIKGPLPTELLLRYGSEIADALERAHRHGVIHRDLKPGNIMLTKDGAKLLDFGLARMDLQTTPAAETLTRMEIDNRRLTEEGVILGTFQYMAPEQLEGKDADARTDIFALGAVLYEMATAKTAFSGKTRTSLIASILASEPPPMSALQPLTPPALERVVKTCLAKDPDARWQSAQDLKLQLQWIAEGGSQAGVPAPVVARRKRREGIAWAIALLTTLAAIALSVGYVRRAPVPAAVVRFTVAPPAKFVFPDFMTMAVAPDGRKLAFVATDEANKAALWIRPVNGAVPYRLPGFSPRGVSALVWSPDGRLLLFAAEGKLQRVDASSGAREMLCDLKGYSPFSMNAQGVMLLVADHAAWPAPISRLNIEDCGLQPTTHLDKSRYDIGHAWPNFLPDGRHFLYAGLRSDKKHEILLGELGSDASRVVLKNASMPIYIPPGYLLFERNGYLMAQPFVIDKLSLTGEAVQLQPGQLTFSGIGGFAVFGAGQSVLAFQEQTEVQTSLVWLDRSGKRLGSVGEPGTWANIRLSPDGKSLLANAFDFQTHTGDLWTRNVEHGSWERFTSHDAPGGVNGVWSPDGRVVIYSALVKGRFALYRKSADGSGEPELLASGDWNIEDWSPDGRYVLFGEAGSTTQDDIWALPLTGDLKPFPFVQTEAEEGDARFSPDGHWVAYAALESDRPVVYLRPFPGPGGHLQISAQGGDLPHWSHDGSEIYYRGADGKLMAVSVKLGASPSVGTPHALFLLAKDSEFEPSSDGKRFLVSQSTSETAAPITVVVNWYADLKVKQ
jgi:Tol biopolymer transport system component/predicted Ser/Thr protein kinase